MHPVRGRGAAVEQPGRRQDEGAGAQRRDPHTAPRARPRRPRRAPGPAPRRGRRWTARRRSRRGRSRRTTRSAGAAARGAGCRRRCRPRGRTTPRWERGPSGRRRRSRRRSRPRRASRSRAWRGRSGACPKLYAPRRFRRSSATGVAPDDGSVNASERVLVYGATGHTGRFVVDELLRRGLTPVLAGRSAERLAAVAPRHAALDHRVVGLDDPDLLRQAVAGAGAVINCAGPFLDTAVPLARAAVEAGAHYLDVTAEQPAVPGALPRPRRPGPRRRRRRRPRHGLLRRARRPAPHRRARRRLTRGRGRGRDRPGPLVADRRHPGHRRPQHRDPPGDPRRRADRRWPVPRRPAPGPTRRRSATSRSCSCRSPRSSRSTRHLDVGELRSYLNTAPLDDLHDAATPPPSAVDESGRSAQQFVVDVVVRRGSDTRRISASGRDIYAVTAPIVVEGAVRLLDGRHRGPGAMAPGEAFDAADVLATVGARHRRARSAARLVRA